MYRYGISLFIQQFRLAKFDKRMKSHGKYSNRCQIFVHTVWQSFREKVDEWQLAHLLCIAYCIRHSHVNEFDLFLKGIKAYLFSLVFGGKLSSKNTWFDKIQNISVFSRFISV